MTVSNLFVNVHPDLWGYDQKTLSWSELNHILSEMGRNYIAFNASENIAKWKFGKSVGNRIPFSFPGEMYRQPFCFNGWMINPEMVDWFLLSGVVIFEEMRMSCGCCGWWLGTLESGNGCGINCTNYILKKLFVSQRLPFEWVQFDTYAAFPGSSGWCWIPMKSWLKGVFSRWNLCWASFIDCSELAVQFNDIHPPIGGV